MITSSWIRKGLKIKLVNLGKSPKYGWVGVVWSQTFIDFCLYGIFYYLRLKGHLWRTFSTYSPFESLIYGMSRWVHKVGTFSQIKPFFRPSHISSCHKLAISGNKTWDHERWLALKVQYHSIRVFKGIKYGTSSYIELNLIKFNSIEGVKLHLIEYNKIYLFSYSHCLKTCLNV